MYRRLVLELAVLQLCFNTRYCAVSDYYTVLVDNQQSEIQVSLVSSSGQTSFVEINGYSLPPECTSTYHCNVTVQSNGTEASALIPLEKGVVYITYTYDPTEGGLVYRNHHIIAINRSCNPISASFTTQSMAFLLCTNMTASTPFITFMSLDLGNGNDGPSQVSYLSTWTIKNTDFFSEPLYIPDQANCPNIDPDISSNIFLMDDLYAVAFITNPDLGSYMTSLNILPLSIVPYCPKFLRLEYYGNNKAIMRCSNTSGYIFSLCRKNAVPYDWSQWVPYPCSNWGTIVSLFPNGSLVVTSPTYPWMQLHFPYTIADAVCVHGNNPVFVFALHNGTVLALAVYSGKLIAVSRVTVPRQGRWFSWSADPSIIKIEDGQIFMVLEMSGQIVIKNLTSRAANLSVPFEALQYSTNDDGLGTISYVPINLSSVTIPLPVRVSIHAGVGAGVCAAILIIIILIIAIALVMKKRKNSEGQRDLDSNNELPPHNTNDDHGLTHCLQSSQNPYDSSYDNTSSHPHEDKNNSNTHEITTPHSCSDENAGYMVSGYALLSPILLHTHEVAHQDLSRKDTDDKRNDLHQKASNLHV